jgi:cyclase
MHPYIDRSAGASCKNWGKVLEAATKQFDKNTQYVFGHAFEPLKVTGTVEDIKQMQDYMEKLVAFVESSIKQAKPRRRYWPQKLSPA